MCTKTVSLLLVTILLLVMAGCTAHVHTIGTGPKGLTVEEQRQWYVLWGLVPVNEVDTAQMAAGTRDYEIKTEASVLDFVINIFTSYVSVVSRTVTVTK